MSHYALSLLLRLMNKICASCLGLLSLILHCHLFAQDVQVPEARILLKQYNAQVQAEVFVVHEEAVADLKGKYAAALEKEQEAAQKLGDLEAAISFKAEKEAVQAPGFNPAAKEEKGPMKLQKMRATYEVALLKLEQTRNTRLAPITKAAVSALQALVSDLTKSGRLDEALATKKMVGTLLSTPAAGHVAESIGAATFTNTLGMAFVPVPDTSILMCIHETRNADYLAYAKTSRAVNHTWKEMAASMSSKEDDDKPVTGVSHHEALAFCAWLSKKEGRTYRLPSDEEWSAAVGIRKLEKRVAESTPESLSKRVEDVYPWNGPFPPVSADRCGNYADLSLGNKQKTPVIEGYSDGHPYTAPVMSFKPNELGIFDLGGNVWEWVEDWYNEAQQKRALRGSAWNGRSREVTLSSTRDQRTPGDRGNNHGFRVVTLKSP